MCCVTHREQDSLVRTAIKGLSDDEVEIDVISGLREEILPELQKKIADGIEIVVAGGANARIVRDFCNIPVLEYRISSSGNARIGYSKGFILLYVLYSGEGAFLVTNVYKFKCFKLCLKSTLKQNISRNSDKYPIIYGLKSWHVSC